MSTIINELTHTKKKKVLHILTKTERGLVDIFPRQENEIYNLRINRKYVKCVI